MIALHGFAQQKSREVRKDARLRSLDEAGAVMVEYVIALTAATLLAVTAMYTLGHDMANYYMWAQSIVLWPI
jgi:Flp pilus assembly pilin Flp